VQFKVRVIPDLVDTLGIQNFEKTANEFHEGVYLHPRMGQRNALSHARG
jgi:hypothetical protein